MRLLHPKPKRSTSLIDRLKGLLTVAAFIAALVAFLYFFGKAFNRYPGFFLLAWISITLVALALNTVSAMDSLTLKGMRQAQIYIMTALIVVSAAMFFARDPVRNTFGKHFVEGYRYWSGGYDYDERGDLYYLGDNWTAKNEIGSFAVSSFELSIFIGVFALPAIALKATRRAIQKKESKCLHRTDGVVTETYNTEM